jgi:uncharacterized protein (UPF0332 family)
VKPESTQLLEKAKRSLDAARRLLDSGDFDFAADRAYYAVFYTAEALLAERDLHYSSHGAVHGAFGREFAKTGQMDAAFHRLLLNAFDLRQEAVYLIDMDLGRLEVEEMISQAEGFREAASNYLEEPQG